MAGLNFGGRLFTPSPFPDEDGLLNERWNQEGSTLLNLNEAMDFNDSTVTMHTVTTGKKVYIKQIIFIVVTSFNGKVQVNDDGVEKLTYNSELLKGTYVHNFATPLEFTTNVQIGESAAAGGMTCTMVGWEE